MGRPKPLLPWGDRTMVGHTVATVRAGGWDDVTVVSGGVDRSSMVAAVGADTRVLHNEDWQSGRGGGLQMALSNLLGGPQNPSSVLIALCDQPLMTADDYRRLRICLQSESVVATRYPGDKPGVPVAMTGDAARSVPPLGPDQGLQNWLVKLPSETLRLIDCPAALRDVDTPEEYRALRCELDDAPSFDAEDAVPGIGGLSSGRFGKSGCG